MKRRKNNEYRFDGNLCYVKCSNLDIEFLIDTYNYQNIKEHTWGINGNNIITHINRKTVLLTHFLLKIDPKKKYVKVLHENGDSFDYRMDNLYTGNKYIKQNEFYEVVCFGGKKFLIDEDDYERVKNYVWHIDSGGYVITKAKETNKIIKIHRLILELLDSPGNIEVDHINRDKADNRKQNLRIANRSQNCINQISNVNTSGTVGVYWNKSANKWCSQINKDNVRYYLGSYDDISDAINARKNAEKKLHGEFTPK